MAGDTPTHNPDTETPATYEAFACPADHVHVEIKMKVGKPIALVFDDPDEAYTFAQTILRAYDDAVGITPPA